MGTASFISIALALVISFTPLGLTAGRYYQTGQEPEKKKKEEPKVSGDLGTKDNPVRCKMPAGERAYLNRLRCADGKAPKYSRIGSFAPGPYGNILDGYNVQCEEKEAVTVFMDMYHDHVEKEPVPGFTIVNDEP